MVIDFNRPNSPLNAPAGATVCKVANAQPTRSKGRQAGNETNTVSGNASDTVQLSPEAQRLQQAADKLADQPL